MKNMTSLGRVVILAPYRSEASPYPTVWILVHWRNFMFYDLLKGVWHEGFDFRFFSWISFSGPLSISLGIFTKICGDIHNFVDDTSDKLFTGVNEIGDKLCSKTACPNFSL